MLSEIRNVAKAQPCHRRENNSQSMAAERKREMTKCDKAKRNLGVVEKYRSESGCPSARIIVAMSKK